MPLLSDTDFDIQMMRLALSLANRGRYTTRPNPAVGCVIVQNKQVVASGWHQQAGQPHAERVALAQAEAKGVSLAGATAYVTLEPCSHFGKTPPCAHALIASKVARVVVAMQDPNPLVAGKGIALLKDAGISVTLGVLQHEAEQLNAEFIYAMRHQRPFVRIKMASSLDGRTAMANGESHWITGPEARLEVHKMRAAHGAILTGIETVLHDNPSLNVRLNAETLAELGLTAHRLAPIRLVLDTHLRLPLTAQMLDVAGQVVVFCAEQALAESSEKAALLRQKQVELVAMPLDANGRIDLSSVLSYLHDKMEIRALMVEAGAGVAGAFIQAGLVNEVHAFIAPILLGNEAKPMFSLPGLVSMADKVRLQFQSVQTVGKDLHCVLTPFE